LAFAGTTNVNVILGFLDIDYCRHKILH
jgi:hypothetical protein